MEKNKVLIIRFSSFGDIVQCSSVVELIRQKMGKATSIHWATRSEFEFLVKLNNEVDVVWSFQKKAGFRGLIRFCLDLKKQNFTHVYDCHNNVRSTILKFFLRSHFPVPQILTRSKERLKRILLFKFRINLFPKPFKGAQSYIAPLENWGIENNSQENYAHWTFSPQVEEKIKKLIADKMIIALVPSAAWDMKRWPLEHWKKLIALLPGHQFVVLGGKEDTFCQELADCDPNRVKNFAGQLSLVESCCLIKNSAMIISADTGLLHVADALGIKGLSLMGPTAFGFTVSTKIKTMEVELPCRPCSKDGSGRCTQAIWQRCMVEILPSAVARETQQILMH